MEAIWKHGGDIFERESFTEVIYHANGGRKSLTIATDNRDLAGFLVWNIPSEVGKQR